MYTLLVKGPRRATLAYHRCESYAEVRELIEVYHALGYEDSALIVVERQEEQAA